MTLESSITQLNDSVQTLIKVISGLDAVTTTPKAVKAVKATKAAKAAPAKEATPVASVEADIPKLDDVIAEMRAISDRKILQKLLSQFGSATASGVPEENRAALIEAIHMELQGAA